MRRTLASIAAAAILGATLTVGTATAVHADSWENKNALASAQSYVKILDFSEQGLYDQLTSEYGGDFPAAAAKYALKHLKVNYKREALGAAKSYQKTLHLSKNAIYDQLTSEFGGQFTNAQAKWAIKHL